MIINFHSWFCDFLDIKNFGHFLNQKHLLAIKIILNRYYVQNLYYLLLNNISTLLYFYFFPKKEREIQSFQNSIEKLFLINNIINLPLTCKRSSPIFNGATKEIIINNIITLLSFQSFLADEFYLSPRV